MGGKGRGRGNALATLRLRRLLTVEPKVPRNALAGVFGAFSVVSALHYRDHSADGRGQEIDLSATETMFRVLDFLAIEYDQLGVVRGRSGNLNAYSAPSDVYRTRDGRWIAMAVSAPTVFARLARALDRVDLLDDPLYSTNTARLANRDEIERITRDWFSARSLAEVTEILRSHDVSFAPIHDIKDIFEDPHFAARKAIVTVPDEQLGTVRMQNVVPRFSRTPGAVWRTGPSLGQHNTEVLCGELDLTPEELDALKSSGAI